MLVFGDVAPPARQWWAPWVHALFFGAFAALLTWGSTYMEPLGRERTFFGYLVGFLWLVTVAALVRAIVVTIRRPRAR